MKVNFYKRYLLIILFLFSVYLIYGIYKEDMFRWLCKNEDNKAACMVVGLIQKEKGNDNQASYYFKKSCDLDYVLGCIEKGRWEEKIGRKKISQVYFLKACKLGEEKFCYGKMASPIVERP